MPTPPSAEMMAKKELFNDAMRGRWDGVVKRYRECRVAQDVKITRTGDTVLHLAVSNGNADIVEELVAAVDPADTGKILGLRNDRGDTPLHLAAALGMERVCRVIADRWPKLILEARNKERETSLFVAALHGRVGTFLALHRMSRRIASRYRDLSYCKRKDGDTVLHCAIAGEHFEMAFQIMYLYGDLINVKNGKGETALHLLANKPHAFKSGSHLELFDRIIYACIVVHPLGINMIDEYDADDSSRRRNGDDHTDLFSMSKRFWAKIAGTGSDKKENKQGNSGRLSEAPTQPPDSTNHHQPSNPVTNIDTDPNDSLEDILTEGGDSGHEQERTTSFPYGDQYQDGYGAWEELENYSLREIVTEGDPDEGPRARTLSGLSRESFKAAEEEEEHQITSRNKDVRKPPDSYGYSLTRAQILENVAAWSIFLIYALKILLVILGVVGIGIWRMHIIRERKQKHKYAFQIMEELVERSTLWEYEDMRRPHSQYATKKDTPILIAAKKGVKEVVKKILDTFPVAVQDVDAEGKNVVLLAVENRQPDVYKLMLKRITVRDSVFGIADAKGNSALHLAATLGDNHRPWAVPGAALQMQWEIKWYKFIERSMEHDIFVSFNKEGQTAKEIFSDHHKELIKEGSKWLTNTSQSCSVVAALIAAVAFASISTVPGGTDQRYGTPLLENKVAFEIFAISSLVALCSSVTSLVMFLSILTSRYEEADFGKDLPRKLILGLTFVFLSIAAMLVAFCSAHFFVVQRKLRYIAYPIYAVSCLPITLFAMAHFRLYIDLITATITHVPQRAYKIHSF